MTRAQLAASRALWLARERYRYSRWRDLARTRPAGDPLRSKWHRLWDVAHKNRVHRDHQLAKLEVTGVSDQLLDAVSDFEGGRGPDGLFHPYRDSVGVWTIGFGHTEGVGPKTRPLTLGEAKTLLRKDMASKYVPPVITALKRNQIPVTQNRVDALSSFSYNLGPGLFTGDHDIARALTARDDHRIAESILLYDKAGGRRLEGLTRRRRWEHDTYLKDVK